MVYLTLHSGDFKKKIEHWDLALKIQVLDFVAKSIDKVRAQAAKDEIIANETGYRNPYFARMSQPNTAGRLTERTGKMIKLLEEDLHEPFDGGVVRDKRTTAFRIRAYKSPASASSSYFRGQLRLEVSDVLPNWVLNQGKHPRKGEPSFDVMPKESPLTVKFRFLWENRGRPYLLPAVEKLYPQIITEAQQMVDSLIGYLK